MLAFKYVLFRHSNTNIDFATGQGRFTLEVDNRDVKQTDSSGFEPAPMSSGLN